jgi:hypothetical protein
MRQKIDKARKAFKEGGFTLFVGRTIKYLYNLVYSHFPKRYLEYNGVGVPAARLFEDKIPTRVVEDRENYEEGIVRSIERNVRKDDEVILLGGGYGVTAVKAAQQTGDASFVSIFEASEEQVELIMDTLERNDYRDIEVNNAVVGSEVDVWGSSESAESLNPGDIPSCDVLEMDIEGSEKEVLKNLEIRPRVLIVESHGFKGSKTKRTRELVSQLGYNIQTIDLAENTEFAKQNDVKIVTGIKEN